MICIKHLKVKYVVRKIQGLSGTNPAIVSIARMVTWLDTVPYSCHIEKSMTDKITMFLFSLKYKVSVIIG